MINTKKHTILWFYLVALFAIIFFASLSMGSVMLKPSQWWALIHSPSQTVLSDIIFHIRFPRVMAAFAIGGLLSLSGALLQVLLKNPLADPYIMGVSGGASFFALCALSLGLTGLAVNGFALIGSAVSMMIIFLLMQSRLIHSNERLTLIGVLLASVWAALLCFVLTLSHSHQVYGLLFWLMGDLNFVPFPAVLLIVLLFGLMVCLLLAHPLNILAAGAEQARVLGVNVSRLQGLLFLMSSVLTAVAVSSSGNIGFVGLMMPHVIRLLGVNDYRILLPMSVLLGGTFLISADLLSRMILVSQQLPVGIMTALLGVPFCMALCLRRGSL